MANANAIPMVPAGVGQAPWKSWIQYGVVALIATFFLYVTGLMYVQGELFIGSMVLLFAIIFTWVFTSNRAYVWRYVFPGLLGVTLFVILPIFYTLGLTFTNKSNVHLLSYEQATNFFLQQSYAADDATGYGLNLYEADSGYYLMLEDDDGNLLLSDDVIPMTHIEPIEVVVSTALTEPELPLAPRRAAIDYRAQLDVMQVILPDGTPLVKSRLREFSERYSLWTELADGQLQNNYDGTIIQANMDDGYFYDAEGEIYTPGFEVNIGFTNYVRVLTEDGLFAPFLQIFTWTMFFSVFTVVATFILGLILASLVQWEPIKFRGFYQLMLILPYAIPSFILIMIFRSLFNQNFGQINHVLEVLFNISPAWNSDPNFSRAMILIVNVFLGYPYMFIICLGMLQAIPRDLYEASSLDGSGAANNFFKITLPLVLRPMLPVLISSFAYNFNNFVLIQLLTRGAPIIVGSNPAAGETDLLVNYAYRLAFVGDSQEYALAATISTFIFMMVGLIAVFYIRATKIEVGQKK